MRKKIAKLVSRLSFIKDFCLKDGSWEFVYSDYKSGKLRTTSLPLRTTKPVLQRRLKKIKEDIGYHDKSPSISDKSYFVLTSQFTYNNGVYNFDETYKKPDSLIPIDKTKRTEYNAETGEIIFTEIDKEKEEKEKDGENRK